MEPAMRKYAREQTAERLRRFAFELARVAKQADADAIHDLRVSIRRFTQCLRIFPQFMPKGKVKKVRRRLRTLMALAAEVRNQDIALELVTRAGAAQAEELKGALTQRRTQTEQDLLAAARQWNRQNVSRKWRAQLEI
jgi:CHAD domain-containing protein